VELENFYPLILDSMSDGVFTVDSQFRITYFNRAAERIVGIPLPEAVGMRCYDVFKADICQGACAMRATLTTGEPVRDMRATILNSKMKEVPVCVSTAVLRDDAGGMVGGVEVFQDLSDLEFLKERLSPSGPFHGMLGVSREMRRLFSTIPDVAQSDATVLISGESGTGKELVARALHAAGTRAGGPFIAVNCAAFPDTLLESELFGYEKGAFTGAMRSKPGHFTLANGGTLFLDEIGDISPAFQAKLLRVLEDHRVLPLGGTRAKAVDVRVVAATNRDLKVLMEEGLVRPDFFYRVSVVPLHIPPLRERREDILPLARHYLRVYALRHGKGISNFTHRALGLLRDYDYPGNVRELVNVVERAVVLSRADSIGVEDLPEDLRRRVNRPSVAPIRSVAIPDGVEPCPSEEEPVMAAPPREPGCVEVRTVGAETEFPPPVSDDGSGPLLAVLQECRWNRARAASVLGISRTTLWRRMKEAGLA
jgi:PAS domain S-box-containing protein